VIRVLHLPGRTPYARKLHGPGIEIVNETRLSSGEMVPRDASFGWLHARSEWHFFDVLHVHSLELAADEVVDAVLDRCAADGKRMVLTVHDVGAMFETGGDGYERKLAKVAGRGLPIVTLTEGAAGRLAMMLGEEHRPRVLPHGYVIDPVDQRFGGVPTTRADADDCGVVYALYGGFRPNRLMYPVCVNVAFGTLPKDCLRVLARALSPVELRDGADATRVTACALRDPGKVRLSLRPFPSDAEIATFLAAADVLVMPYLWGTHSGQLEAAFDLGLVPVISDTGFFREQWHGHHGLVPEPVWFDWSDGAEYAYGARLLEAILRARDQVTTGMRMTAAEFRDHRRTEHDRVLAGYRELYEL
jgi:hypothetical protein